MTGKKSSFEKARAYHKKVCQHFVRFDGREVWRFLNRTLDGPIYYTEQHIPPLGRSK